MTESLSSKLPLNVKEYITKNIDDTFDKLELTATDRKYLQPIYRKVGIILFILGFPCFILMGFSMWSTSGLFLTILAGIVTFMFFIAGGITYYLWSKSWNKVISAFNNLDLLSEFYSHYTQDVYPDVVINKVSDHLIGLPKNHQSFYDRFFYKNTFVGDFKKLPFQIGTIVYEKVTVTYDSKGNRQTSRSYYRKLYLIAKTDPTELVTTITKEDAKIFQKLRRQKDRLESSEFEQLFKLKYDDPINLRKLLKPAIMEKLTDIAIANDKKVPTILINDDTFTFIWNMGLVGSSSSELLCSFNKVYTPDAIKTTILDNVYQDTEILVKYLKWLESFDVHRLNS